MAIKPAKVVGYVYNVYLQGKDHLLVKVNQPQPTHLPIVRRGYTSKVDLGPSYLHIVQ